MIALILLIARAVRLVLTVLRVASSIIVLGSGVVRWAALQRV